MDIPGYQIIEPIRRDEEGADYLATQECSGQQVIVKFLNKALLPDSVSLGNYIEEGQYVSAISHPNIAKVHEVGGNDENIYMVMEYVSGVSLEIKRQDMCLLDKIYVIKQIAETLDYLKSKGCGHFNLKPSNIIISEHDSRVILIGFDVPSKHKLTNKTKKVSESSANYISPEHILSHPLDLRSDLYSLGGIFYTLLSGVPPYQAEKIEDIFTNHHQAVIPSLSESKQIFQHIIDKSMTKSPEDRYQTGEELIFALDQIDDEDIIKADIEDGCSVEANTLGGEAQSDNVVVLPTALSMQAARSEKTNDEEETDRAPKDSLEKLNEKQTHQEQSEREHKNRNEHVAETEVTNQGEKTEEDEQVTALSTSDQKPVIEPHVDQAPPKEIAEEIHKSEALDLNASQVEEHALEETNNESKTKSRWSSKALLVLVLIGVGYFGVQQKLYEQPVVNGFIEKVEGAWGQISSLIASSGQQVKEKQISNDSTTPPLASEASNDKELQTKTVNHESDVDLKVNLETLPVQKPEVTSQLALQESSVVAENIQPENGELKINSVVGAETISTEKVLQPIVIPKEIEKKELPTQIKVASTVTAEKNQPTAPISSSQKQPVKPVEEKRVQKPKASLLPTTQATIDRLLSEAEAKRASGNLLHPADDNAVLIYRKILALDSNNQAANSAMYEIRNIIIGQVEAKMENGQLISADALLTRMSIFFNPEPPVNKLVERLNLLLEQRTSQE